MAGTDDLDMEKLLRDLREEYGAEEPLPAEVRQLLRDLDSDRLVTRKRAAEQLGALNASGRQVVQALISANWSDPILEVRTAAAQSLRAPVHQEVLNRHPDLLEAAQKIWKQFSDGPAILGREAVIPPKGIQIHRDERDITLVSRWLAPSRVILVFLAVSFGVVPILVMLLCVYSGASEGYPWLIVVGIMPFGLIGVAVLYWVLASGLNKTVVRVSSQFVDVRHIPVPWPGSRHLESSVVRELVIKGVGGGYSSTDASEGYRDPLYQSVRAKTTSGMDVVLAPGLTYEQAVYLRQEIERCLASLPVSWIGFCYI